MTDIEKKALALVNEVSGRAYFAPYTYLPFSDVSKALCRAIEQHEAFRQEVSDEVEAALACGDDERLRREGILSRFIIAKPDPLVEALKQLNMNYVDAEDFREALAKRGGKIVWGEAH